MNNLITILISLIALFSMSCQEVINIDLEEGQKRLVVEGRVALEAGKSKSKSFILFRCLEFSHFKSLFSHERSYICFLKISSINCLSSLS